ncbi:hypothetical protein RFF05_13040 [Bengtsoniella intestinalis]|uniref:hypothetical protein n=1 Tax=Bengtsoniella intestinalis TaxID=3073143 RepID=UPI00391F3641
MATTSIFKSVHIKGAHETSSFARAMEEAEKRSASKPQQPSTWRDASREEIREMFKGYK